MMYKRKSFFFIRSPYMLLTYLSPRKREKKMTKQKPEKGSDQCLSSGGRKAERIQQSGVCGRASVGHTPQLTGSILISGPRGRDLEGLSRPFAAPSSADANVPFPRPAFDLLSRTRRRPPKYVRRQRSSNISGV